MDSTWILVADTNQARIFITFKGEKSLYELDKLTHPGSRITQTQMAQPVCEADYFLHASSPQVAQWQPSKRQEAIGFARQIANHLEYARSRGKFHRLVIVAAADFLTTVRDCMSSLTAKLVVEEIDKNLTTKTPLQIHRQLPQHVTAPPI